MKHFKLFLTCLLLTVLGVGNVWGETWTLVSKVSDIEEGSYLLLTATYKPWTGDVSSGHLTASSTALSFTDGKTTSIPSDAKEVSLVSTGAANQYYIKTSSTDYLYAKAAKSGSFVVGTTSDKWTFSGTDGLNALGDNYSVYIRGYNGTSFRSYTGTSNGTVIYLAKKTGSTKTTHFPTPRLSPIACRFGGLFLCPYLSTIGPFLSVDYQVCLVFIKSKIKFSLFKCGTTLYY